MNHHSQNSHRPNHGDAARNARTFTGALLSATLVAVLHATGPGAPAKNLGDLSLEELMNETITSVSKKEQPLFDSAAAISVLSNDDLRRSGATSIAEALHLVPGMTVGQLNSSQWAISSRGFSNQFANKLLVMIDGRAVYSPLFSGVYWDLQQPMLEDVYQIEVIRGPGATVWGANAVNGVINVVSKSARDTQGSLVYGSAGNVHLTMDGARYGGQIGKNTYYRVYGSYQLSDDFKQPNGQSAMDGWQSGGGGFRVDHYRGGDTHLTWQGDATFVDLDDHASDAYNVNTLGRWTREWSDRSSVEVQAYYDRTYRNEATRSRNTIDTLDLTTHHAFGLGNRNDVIWGLGYRFIANKVEQTSPVARVRNSDFNLQLFSAFVQDEFKLIPDKLTFTAGTKIEHNDFTGIEIQPSIRVTFKPTENQTVWASVSRAVRTPSENEGKDVFEISLAPPFPGPGGLYVPTLVGNSSPVSEVLLAYELGYRIQPSKRVNVDLAAFYNNYDHLIGISADISQFIPGIPFGVAETPFVNNRSAKTYGGEAAVTVTPVDHRRLTASYSLLREDIKGRLTPESLATADPRQQAMLRSAYDFKRASFNVQLRYVDRAFLVIPAYVTADVRLSYRPTDKLELSLVGHNLLDGGHLEAVPTFGALNAEIPREFFVRITWNY